MIMLEYKRYHAKLSFDENDNLIIGKLLGIKDEVGFHMTSVDEIPEKFHKAVDEYLEFCKEVGKTPDIPTTALTFSGQ